MSTEIFAQSISVCLYNDQRTTQRKYQFQPLYAAN